MLNTIENALQILSGLLPRSVNIRIDSNESSLIKSLGRQVNRGIGLTDRQLELAIKKIEKYRVGLEKNSFDVDVLIANKPLLLPVRQIDRTQSVYLDFTEDKKTKIFVKYVFSKKFATIWAELQSSLIGYVEESKGRKEISFNEKNLYNIVTQLKPLNFDISSEVQEIYEKVENILERPSDYHPYVDLVDDRLELKNASTHCIEHLKKEFPVYRDEDFLVFLGRVKNCGIYHKNREILKKIDQKTANNFVKKVLADTSTRFRINPAEYGIDTVFDIISELKQWPVLIIVDDKKETISQVKNIVSTLLQYITPEEINIFFRFENNDAEGKEFNQYVKDNKLNNFIGPSTKVVFITKNKIPKPLMSADWRPHTAVLASTYEYGKTSAYISDFLTVYYYNNNLNSNYTRKKGNTVIVQL